MLTPKPREIILNPQNKYQIRKEGLSPVKSINSDGFFGTVNKKMTYKFEFEVFR